MQLATAQSFELGAVAVPYRIGLGDLRTFPLHLLRLVLRAYLGSGIFSMFNLRVRKIKHLLEPSQFHVLRAGLPESHPLWQALLSSFSLQDTEALVDVWNLRKLTEPVSQLVITCWRCFNYLQLSNIE